MKRILTTMCALTLLLAASVPALAVEPEQSASYYPTSVEEYMEGDSPRIKKVYQLSLADDPSQIPTEDFERDGRLYYLLDMTRKDEVGVDIQTITQTKTLASETNNMEKILQSLEPQMEVTTEDGYTGTLTLDHTTVKVAADGYCTLGDSEQGVHQFHAIGHCRLCQHKADKALEGHLRALNLGKAAAGLDYAHHKKQHQQSIANGLQRPVDADDHVPDPAAFEVLWGCADQGPDLCEFVVPGLQCGIQIVYDPVSTAHVASPPSIKDL